VTFQSRDVTTTLPLRQPTTYERKTHIPYPFASLATSNIKLNPQNVEQIKVAMCIKVWQILGTVIEETEDLWNAQRKDQ